MPFLKAATPNTAAPELISSVLAKLEMAKKYCLQMFTLRTRLKDLAVLGF